MINAVRPKKNWKQQAEVFDVARYWTDMRQRLMWTIERDDMTCAGHTSLGRFETGDTAVVRRQPDASSCIAAQVKWRSTRGKDCGSSTTASTRSTLKIVRIVGATVDEVVRFK